MTDQADSLLVIWSSPHPETALNLAFMYAGNARNRGWWERVRLVAWGPSQPLLLGNDAVRERLEDLDAAGVELYACRACSDEYGLSDDLEALGLRVEHTGQMLTEALKSSRWRVVTF